MWIKYNFAPAGLRGRVILGKGNDMDEPISRRAAMDALYSVDEYNSRSVKAIKQLSPIQSKRGKWIYCEDSTVDCVDGYRCDQCGFFVPWDYQHKSIDYIKDYNFCPKCGSYNGG